MNPTEQDIEIAKNVNFDIEVASVFRFGDQDFRGFCNTPQWNNQKFSSFEEGVDYYRKLGFKNKKVLIGEYI